MKIIKREYLKQLIDVMEAPDIKVITGVRRSGKSKLLELFKEYIEKNIKNYNVIFIDFNSLKFEDLKTYITLNDYVEANYKKGKQNFLLIDEVQMCDGFEKAINSLHASYKYQIYVTGSNAFLLSSDLATLFTGRTYSIEVYPFSFSEYVKYFNREDINQALEDYVKDGGLAGAYLYKNTKDRINYVSEVCETLIIRDINQKYRVRNKELIENLTNYLMDNIANITSSRNIVKELNSKGVEINHKTIGTYIKYLCNSYLFYKVKRYDIQGKKYLSTLDKYYLSDHSFKYARLGSKNMNYGRIYENIVAIELLRRGYEVYVGVLNNKEIDFVAINQNEKIYIQVSDNISDEKTFAREVKPLLEIKDAYPKIIIANTKHPTYQYEGVQIYDLTKWLLAKQ